MQNESVVHPTHLQFIMALCTGFSGGPHTKYAYSLIPRTSEDYLIITKKQILSYMANGVVKLRIFGRDGPK